MSNLTYSAKPSDVTKNWHLIDAKDLVLGRVASIIAKIIRGKNKTIYTRNIDTGDYVVVINADKIHLTGSKLNSKKYYWHTGYPGGIKSRTANDLIKGQFPDRVLKKAVERMVPRTPLGRDQLKKLFIYAGEEHKHEAQKPQPYNIAELNNKNSKR